MKDFEDWLLPPGCSEWLDLIVADYPWHYAQGITHAKQKEIVPYATIPDPTHFMRVAYAALKNNRNLWVWSDDLFLPKYLMAAEAAGFKLVHIAVAKRFNGDGMGMGRTMRPQLYFLPFWRKGKAYVNKRVAAGFPQLLVGDDLPMQRSHKSADVTNRILAHSLPPGGIWLDPFPVTHVEILRRKDEKVS